MREAWLTFNWKESSLLVRRLHSFLLRLCSKSVIFPLEQQCVRNKSAGNIPGGPTALLLAKLTWRWWGLAQCSTEGLSGRGESWHLTLQQVCTASPGVGSYLPIEEEKKKALPLCNGKGPSLDPQSAILLVKECGVNWSWAPPSSLNGGIPASRHILSHVCGWGHVLGQVSKRDRGREASSCFQTGDTCGQIWAGWEKRHKQSSTTGFGRRPDNGGKIDSVYAGEFWRDAGCVLICINLFPWAFFLQVVESISRDSVEEVFEGLELHNIPSQRPKVHCVPASEIRRCALSGLHQLFKDQFTHNYEIHVFSLTCSDHHESSQFLSYFLRF